MSCEDHDEYGFQRAVFRLACAYGLRKTAPERTRGEIVLYDDDDLKDKSPWWLWNQERRRWRS